MILAKLSAVACLLAAAAAAEPLHLEGKGAEVVIDLPGFEQKLGPAPLGETYERLGQFSRASLNCSVLLDTVPMSVDLEALKKHVLASSEFGKEPPVLGESKTPPGFFVVWTMSIGETRVFQELLKDNPDAKKLAGAKQWNMTFHTVDRGRWLEVHFSAMEPKDPAALAAEVRRIVRGLRFRPKA
jgi:hypothetical protein